MAQAHDLNENTGAIFTGAFWKATFERSIRTFAQALAATLGGDAVGILDVDPVQALSVAGLAFLLAVLTCIVAGTATHSNAPSFGAERLPNEPGKPASVAGGIE